MVVKYYNTEFSRFSLFLYIQQYIMHKSETALKVVLCEILKHKSKQPKKNKQLKSHVILEEVNHVLTMTVQSSELLAMTRSL